MSQSLLLHCDGVNGSTTFTDSSPNHFTITPVGSAHLSTVWKKFGSASGLFNGSTDYLSVPSSAIALGTNDFTIDFWIYPLTRNYNDGFIFNHLDDTHYLSFYCGSGTFYFYVNNGGSFTAEYSFPYTLSLNTPYHIAIVRHQANLYFFVNGVLQTCTVTVAINANTVLSFNAPLLIGIQYSSFYDGYIDEFHIDIGTAVWTANFTPPTSPYGTAHTLSLTDSVTLIDAIAKNIKLKKADTVTVADGFSRAVTYHRTITDSVTLTDAISKLYEKNTAEALTLVDSLSKVMAYHRSFSDGFTLADNFNIAGAGKYFLTFSETLTLVDAISKEINLPIADAMTLADQITTASTFNRSLSDSMTLTDSMTPVKIQLLTLTIQSKPVIVGQQQQISVMGLYSDGSVQDATAYCQFVSSNTNIATIDGNGLVTGIATGLTIITATIGIVTTNYTLACLPVQSNVIPQTGIVAFADGNSYRSGTYLTRRFEYKSNSIGVIKVLASKYPLMVDLIFPDIPYTISVTVVSKNPQRVKAFLSEAVEVRINPVEEVSAVFLASNISELTI